MQWFISCHTKISVPLGRKTFNKKERIIMKQGMLESYYAWIVDTQNFNFRMLFPLAIFFCWVILLYCFILKSRKNFSRCVLDYLGMWGCFIYYFIFFFLFHSALAQCIARNYCFGDSLLALAGRGCLFYLYLFSIYRIFAWN